MGIEDNLIGEPITVAEEETYDGGTPVYADNSWSWARYRFATSKGEVIVTWLGQSNGFYSEGVEFGEVNERDCD